MKPFPILLAYALLALSILPAAAAPLHLVAAENFYGGVAQQIAGLGAKVVSILTNPNQDPHEFTANPDTARAVADADIVISSGIGYDTWMEKLLATGGKPGRVVIDVAALLGHHDGDNPHIWYDPATMPALAAKLAAVLTHLDPANGATYAQALATFNASLQPERDAIARLRPRTSGMKVTATEPVFGYLAAALGFNMLNADFQIKIMNDSEPSAAETADFEKSLTTHTAKILFYNSQVSDPTTDRLRQIAQQAGIPVLGVTETQPPNEKTYTSWMMDQLAAIESHLP